VIWNLRRRNAVVYSGPHFFEVRYSRSIMQERLEQHLSYQGSLSNERTTKPVLSTLSRAHRRLTLLFGAALLAAPLGTRGRNITTAHAGMDMHDEDMSNMGQVWRPWWPYVMTPLRPKQPGDRKGDRGCRRGEAAIERTRITQGFG